MIIHRKLHIFGSSQLDEFAVLTGNWLQQYDDGESFFLEPYRLRLNYSDDSRVVEFFAMKERLTKAGAYPSPAQMAEIKNIEVDLLVSGKAAMTWISSNQFVALSTAAKRPLTLIMPPRRTGSGPIPQSVTSSQMFSIWKGSAQKEAAARFISYFVNDAQANLILQGERGVPIMKPVRDALSASITPETKAVYDYMDQIGKEAGMQLTLNSPVQAEIKELYKNLSEEVIFGKISPQEAAVRLRTETETVLERARAGN
jgi:multiple sugar transport system substrate-binding protein